MLPVGGIKAKVLAAHRAGLDTVILPRRNEPDVEDVPEEVRQAMTFILVDDVTAALEAALTPPKQTGNGAAAEADEQAEVSRMPPLEKPKASADGNALAPAERRPYCPGF